MKPRNDFERELQHYIDNGELSPVSAGQMEYAIEKMEKDTRYKMWYFNTKQTINGMELLKCYKVHRYGKGDEYTLFNLVIVYAKRGKDYAWAARSTGIGYIDSFSINGQLSIKSEHEWYWNIIANDDLKDYGLTDPYAITIHRYHNEYYFKSAKVETMYKRLTPNDNELLSDYIIDQHKPLPEYLWEAYKVATRHGYNFQGEMWRWTYLVGLLKLNKRDYHNPALICPSNLVEACDTMIDVNDRRLERIRVEKERKAAEKAMKQNKQDAEDYVKNHSRWLGVVIIGENIIIKPLQDIAEFAAEGAAMHHCVYSNGYYRRADTLILSAKDSDGNRLATIEYNLKTRQIIQCRAACNQHPERYDEICALVKDGMREKKYKYAA